MSSLYIYGVVSTDKPITFEVEGLAGGMRVIVEGGIGAIVGTAPQGNLHGQSREETVRLLLAHQEVLEAAMVQTTVLPVKFGALAPGENAIRRMLMQGKELLGAQLAEFTDHLQMEIVVLWRLDQVFAEIATERDIAELTRRAQASGDKDESVRLGQAVKAALERRRALLSEEICDLLSTVATDMAANQPKDDRMAANVALLLNKTDMGSLEGMLNRLDAEMAGEIDFRAIGPLPPSSFATVEVTFPPRGTSGDRDWLLDASAAADMVMINIIRQQLQPPVYGVTCQDSVA